MSRRRPIYREEASAIVALCLFTVYTFAGGTEVLIAAIWWLAMSGVDAVYSWRKLRVARRH